MRHGSRCGIELAVCILRIIESGVNVKTNVATYALLSPLSFARVCKRLIDNGYIVSDGKKYGCCLYLTALGNKFLRDIEPYAVLFGSNFKYMFRLMGS